jgi:hypothetical protein
MKVTIKPGLIIFHKPFEWERIQYQLGLDYGTKIMISYVCKRELGFTIRRHKGLEEHPKEIWEVMKSEGWHQSTLLSRAGTLGFLQRASTDLVCA